MWWHLKADKSLIGALSFGLLVIFATVLLVVLKASPKPKTPAQLQALVDSRQGMIYFIDAEMMAKQLAPDPDILWSHDHMDANTGCIRLGNDVWYARGMISGQKDGVPLHSTWEVLFLPEQKSLLYERVDHLAEGDPKSALERAHAAHPPAQGNTP